MIALVNLGIAVGIIVGDRQRANANDFIRLQKPSCHKYSVASILHVWLLAVRNSIGLFVCRSAALISATKNFQRE
jgi:hypothetical protein